jgi:type I restriction-modification system DNA methylase subunit
MSNEIIKELTAIIKQFENNKSTFEIFRDVIEICSISEHQEIFNLGMIKKNEDYQNLEKQYLEIMKKYKKLDVDLMVKFYAILKSYFMNDNHDDLLGSLYMSLELGNKNSGQFFTPYHISKFMAEIQISNIEEKVKERGYFSISDPCVGAGGMIIAASDVVKNSNIGKSKMIFQAIDIDKLCFNMCYVQLSMLRLNGVVMWGDSLKCEAFEIRKTPALILTENQTKCKNVKNLIEQMEILRPIERLPEINKNIFQDQSEQLTLF